MHLTNSTQCGWLSNFHSRTSPYPTDPSLHKPLMAESWRSGDNAAGFHLMAESQSFQNLPHHLAGVKTMVLTNSAGLSVEGVFI